MLSRFLCLTALAVGLTACQHTEHRRQVDQCSLPVSQREGGWVCAS